MVSHGKKDNFNVAPVNAESEEIRLTVLIPVYNWDATPLLQKIVEEADAFSLWGKIEVLVLDDASSDAESSSANYAFSLQHQHLQYSRLESNVGRAAIRNLLAAKANGDFLLFLDCDVLPDGDRFLRDYLACAEADAFDVVCGGRSYRTRLMADPQYDYHTYFGNKKEVQPASVRNHTPWRLILTSNIMVRKNVFQDVSFDERFVGYGYEDIEWGVRLADKYRVLHIDNTASHIGLVTKAVAYQKMRESVPNYLLLREICPEAFGSSAISRAVSLLLTLNPTLLNLLDRMLRQLFLEGRSGNRLAFLFFQFNFAVLLAGALKERKRLQKGAACLPRP